MPHRTCQTGIDESVQYRSHLLTFDMSRLHTDVLPSEVATLFGQF